MSRSRPVSTANQERGAHGRIGVIMLDTRFPRFPGDIGNPTTWPFAVELKTVTGASAEHVVNSTDTQALQPFINAALDLQDAGVCGITTSCGFLALLQNDIAKHLEVPFIASSLSQVPWVQAMLPMGKLVGILTIDANALSHDHLMAAGVRGDVPVMGTEQGKEFHQRILSDAESMDQSLCERDNVEAALQLVEQHPNLGALVLECTNMAPYANAINTATGLPVYSIYTLMLWFQAGLAPVSFAQSAYARPDSE